METMYDFQSTTVIIVFIFSAIIISGAIFLIRFFVSKQKVGCKQPETYKERIKYLEKDIFKFRPTILNGSLFIALALSFFSFNWTKYSDEIYVPDNPFVIEEDIQIEPPRTADPPLPPPLPPLPLIEEVPSEEISEEEEPVFIDQTIEEKTIVRVTIEKDVPPPPPPPPPPGEADDIFLVVEEMPRFPGCDNVSITEAKTCSDAALYRFLYKHLKYPAIARGNGIEGTVVIKFIIERDGSVSGLGILRNIGGNCGEEALRVVGLMNQMSMKWTPGKQSGRPVKVQFILPVRFKLE